MEIKYSTVLKLACSLFIVYYTFISVIWPSTNGWLTPLCGVMLVLILFDVAQKGSAFVSEIIDFPIGCWITFAVIAIGVAPFVAVNVSFAVDSALTFLKLVVMCFSIVYIAKECGNVDFCLYTMYVTSVIYVIYMYYTKNYIGGRLALINANSDAFVCLLGIVNGSLILNKRSNILYKVLIIGSMAFMAYVSLMTGSRKTLVCMVVYVVLWLITELKTTWNQFSSNTKVLVSLLFVVILYYLVRYGMPIFHSSVTYMRLDDEYALGSDRGRIELFKEAWTYFLKNPLFGIGYNQFRLYNLKGLYSHSTYTEILANTGLVGTIFFFAPHIWCLSWLIRLSSRKTDFQEKRVSLLFLVYMISSLILALGMNQMNNERVLMMYSIIFAYILCETREYQVDLGI